MNDKEASANIETIAGIIGNKEQLVIREILIGNKEYLEAAIIYMNGLANKDLIDRDILNPLMYRIDEYLNEISSKEDYICKKYISVSNTNIETDINKAADSIKRGKTVIVISGSVNFIVSDTTGGTYRAIEEPVNDASLRGPREGFIENLETNISIMQRRIKDRNLLTENFTLGRRSQTDLTIMYLDDVVDKEFLQKIKDKINSIDIDYVPANSIIEQCIEEHPYGIFPQVIGSERPDVVEANLMEGRIAFLLSGTPYVTTYPTVFFEFFQTTEDYYGRTIQASFVRILRIFAVIIVLTFPSIYITVIQFNPEMIPIEYVKALIANRKGIALTPFMSLFTIKLTLELLREGGLRLPGKIGQTLSVVGGIIIGDAVLKAKIISSSTLFVAGITTVASFAISNYQMSNAIRILGYPMLILANWLGVLGILIGCFFILAYLCSLENYDVPYFAFHKNDMKDIIIRAPIWKMDNRPAAIPHSDPVRQGNTRGGKNE